MALTREKLLNEELRQLKKKIGHLETQLALGENALTIGIALDNHSFVTITDARGVITYVNDRFCHQSRYLRAELIGATYQILRSGEHSEDFCRNLWKTISSGEIWRGMIKHRAKDGCFFWVEMSVTPILAANGQIHQ
jgi:PAS domain S-box-containing protein